MQSQVSTARQEMRKTKKRKYVNTTTQNKQNYQANVQATTYKNDLQISRRNTRQSTARV